MTRRILSLWLLAALVPGVAIGVAWPRAAAARRDAAAARETLDEAVRHADLIVALHVPAAEPPPVTTDPAAGGLTPRLAAALQQAGLPAGALASLSPEAESLAASQGGLRVMRRRATVTLAGVTLVQVGRFLDAWRSSEPAWIPSRIDLTPVGGKPPEAGGDLPLRAVVVVEAVTLSQTGAPR